MPPPLPTAPVAAHCFFQEELVRRDERTRGPFLGPAALSGVLPGTLSSLTSQPLLLDIPCCVTQHLRPNHGAPPPQLGWVLNSVPNPSGQRGPTWSQPVLRQEVFPWSRGLLTTGFRALLVQEGC